MLLQSRNPSEIREDTMTAAETEALEGIRSKCRKPE